MVKEIVWKERMKMKGCVLELDPVDLVVSIFLVKNVKRTIFTNGNYFVLLISHQVPRR